ncbi:MarR family winged helix-turn-helix transcriptional regulator [Timonella senegalensis]|uniref:MarR family winged helix-turn-helix transcriptional regulator n=1 Tax=Timonella senegalensis TaxID=1465825 RepID=UPI0005939A31|nr:MarR family transcriptional regulator [Timonella senegalensis]
MTQANLLRPADVAGEIRVAANRLVRRLRSERGEADLPEHQFIVLTAIKKFGPMTPGALADLEGVRPPSMTRTVNALTEMGFVVKTGSDEDKRQVRVELTALGLAEIKETRRRRDAWLTKKLSKLSHEDRATLAEASEIIKSIAGQ